MEWKLEELFKDDGDAVRNAQDALEDLRRLVAELEEMREPESLAGTLKAMEDAVDKFGASAQYAWMRYSVKTDDTDAQKLLGLIEKYQSEVEEKIALAEVHLISLGEEKLDEIAKVDENYDRFVGRLKKRAKHLLSQDAERILALTSTVRRSAIAKIHSRLESSYRFKMNVDGEERELTTEQMKALRHSADGNLRKTAMEKLLKRFSEDAIAITEVYNLIAKDYVLESQLRNFPSPISMRNFENEIDDETVEKVIVVTSERAELLRKYYRWKSEYLGEKLTPADVYAPLGRTVRKFDFNEAKSLVLRSYYEFDEEAGRIVEDFFNGGRIDPYPRPSKVSGAFCIHFTTSFPAYVLTNFGGDILDVMTLAHELGHGLHAQLSMSQSRFNRYTPLTLAELASVFGEFLVFDKLRVQLGGAERAALIAKKLEEIFATTFRQNTFTLFEKRAFDGIAKEGYLSWEELSGIYEAELRNLYDGTLDVPSWYSYEWAMVSHFFETPFYVYAYNIAQCLVIGLYKNYLEGGKSFAKRYLEALASGGRHEPRELLRKIGIDLSSDRIWEDAFCYVETLVDELTGHSVTPMST